MRIFLLLTFSLFLLLSAKAQIVNIPDANFKNALLTHVPVINTNNDGEIQVIEAVAYTGNINVVYKNISDLTGINAFVNLTGLDCSENRLTSLSISNLTTLQSIKSTFCFISSVQLNNLPALTELIMYRNVNPSSTYPPLVINNLPALKVLDVSEGSFGQLLLSNLNSLEFLICKLIRIPLNLNLNNLPALKKVTCGNGEITTISATGTTALQVLDCIANNITSLTLSNPGSLESLNCQRNKLTSLPSGLTGLKFLNCSENLLTSLSVDNSNALDTLDISGNLLSSFSIANKPALKVLFCQYNQLTNIALNNLPKLKRFNCYSNRLTTLSMSGYDSLYSINCGDNQLTNLALTNLPALWEIYATKNNLTFFSVTDFPSLVFLYCNFNKLTSLILNNLPALKYLTCSDNLLPVMSLSNFPALTSIQCDNNKITTITFQNLPALQGLSCQKNLFSSLTLDGFPSLTNLFCGRSDSLTNLNLTNLPALRRLDCDSAKLILLDISKTAATHLIANNNPGLKYINIKNGAFSTSGSFPPMNLNALNALESICVDDNELAYISGIVNTQLPGQNISVSSFCNFNPNGNYNTIIGTLRFDGIGNGCNTQDSTMYNVKINIDDGIQTGSTFTNTQGNYKFFVLQNPNTITSVFENPYFTSTPPSHTITFAGFGNTQVADFCITANGIHPDLEVILIPVTIARPGFDAQYRLIYRNKGNQFQSGTVTLNFDAIKLNFLSAVPNVTSQTSGNLTWSYAGLSPYETRTINLVLHVNAPPVVNIGDILAFTAVINPIPGDEIPADNTFNFNQIVRGAFDPNDKDVTEGSTIDISKAGDYLHYLIRFQNTGNEAAISVVIKDSLAVNLDWNSFTPITASHAYRAVVSKGNKVEFIFDGINLPGKNTNEPASHGFVSFKIKPKSTVSIGETIYNKAEIYFDYNLPIVTNTVSTTVTEIKHNSDPAGLSVSPNPAKDWLQFSLNPDRKIKSVILINPFGVQVYSEEFKNASTYQSIDIRNLAPGVYFLIVYSFQWRSIQKVMILK